MIVTRISRALALLRFPWPQQHASLWRLVFLCLGASFGALPRHEAPTSIGWRLGALLACALSGFFGTVLLNDITDRELDKIAHPERPLARGAVGVGDAIILCATLYLVTVAAAAALGALLLALVVFWLSVPVAAHYFLGKRGSGGNMSRLYSDLITPLQFAGLGVLVYLGFENYDLLGMFLLASIIYCSDASMNVLQAINDERADSAFRIRTVATRHGPRVASKVAFVLHLGVLCTALTYAWWAALPLAWSAGVVVLWSVVAGIVWRVVALPEAAPLSRAIAATALALQLLLMGLGAVRLPRIW